MKAALTRVPYLAGRARTKLNEHLQSVASVHRKEKHALLQLADIARLRLGRTRVGLGEYIAQGMYSKEIYPGNELSTLGGWWFKERVHSQLNNIRWEGMVTDKLMMYSLFERFGLPHPRVRALGWRRARHCGDIPVFRSAEALADFLRGAGPLFPLFLKPVKGSYGRGSARIEAYEADGDRVVLSGGERAALLPFLHSLEDDGWGVLVQDAVKAPEETRPICGQAVSGCRIIMLLDDEGARPYRAVWKVPALHNFFDNFQGGKSGNTISAVDVASGRVIRTLCGRGANLRVCDRHPETDYPLKGALVPQWEEIMTLLAKAAECFPGLRWQHWDVGITDQGPTLYELNSAGNPDIAQMTYGKGINDAELRTFLRRHGGREPAPGKVF